MLAAYSIFSDSKQAAGYPVRLQKAFAASTTGTASKSVVFRCRCAASTSTPEAAGGDVGDVSNVQPHTVAVFASLPPAPELLGASPQGRWNAVSLAYLGDTVWEALLRSHFYDASNAWQYGDKVAAMVTTQAQAACCELLQREGWLNPAEAALMRWASNNSSVSPPAHATHQQYKQATALETLVAQLYLTDVARLQQLFAWLLQPGRLERWQQAMPTSSQTRRKASNRSSRSSSVPGARQAAKSSKIDSSATNGSSPTAGKPDPTSQGPDIA